jgi:hypothetical protein
MLGTHLKLAGLVLAASTGSFLAGAVSSRVVAPPGKSTIGDAVLEAAAEPRAPGIGTLEAAPTADARRVVESATTPMRLGSTSPASFSDLLGFRPTRRATTTSNVTTGRRRQGGSADDRRPQGVPPGPPTVPVTSVPPGPPADLPAFSISISPFFP